MTLLDSVRGRRSHPRVTADAPDHAALLPLVEAAASTADHGALRPWRLIELRGDARERLGDAFVAASALVDSEADTLRAKPMRASLLIAIVARHEPSFKVPEWEQDAAASGIAHMLSLLLADAGWGVFWRTGPLTSTDPVRLVHHLADNEKLLGWLYVGGIPDKTKPEGKARFDPEAYLSVL